MGWEGKPQVTGGGKQRERKGCLRKKWLFGHGLKVGTYKFHEF